MDKIKFYYNARASLFETIHWAEVLKERNLIDEEKYNIVMDKAEVVRVKLNGWIKFNLDNKLKKDNK